MTGRGQTKRSRKLHLQLKRGAAGMLLQSFADIQRIARRARRNKLPLRYNRAGTKQEEGQERQKRKEGGTTQAAMTTMRG